MTARDYIQVRTFQGLDCLEPYGDVCEEEWLRGEWGMRVADGESGIGNRESGIVRILARHPREGGDPVSLLIVRRVILLKSQVTGSPPSRG